MATVDKINQIYAKFKSFLMKLRLSLSTFYQVLAKVNLSYFFFESSLEISFSISISAKKSECAATFATSIIRRPIDRIPGQLT